MVCLKRPVLAGAAGILGLCSVSTAASADITISSKPMQNMSCQAGVCTATAKKAVLDVGDLHNMLAGGDVVVKTGARAKDIDIDQPLTWASTSRLTLDAQRSVTVNKPVTVAGSGAVTITDNYGASDGDLYFFSKGKVTFFDVASSLVINGQTYTLAADLPSLASKMNISQNGFFALSSDYDAEHDQFKGSPIPVFKGHFEGLGHNIRHLKLRGGKHDALGMFGETAAGVIRDLHLTEADIHSEGRPLVGALMGWSRGQIINASSDGKVSGASEGAKWADLLGVTMGQLSVPTQRLL
jgi:hypothetical protein